jgi:hypothetical protein
MSGTMAIKVYLPFEHAVFVMQPSKPKEPEKGEPFPRVQLHNGGFCNGYITKFTVVLTSLQ